MEDMIDFVKFFIIPVFVIIGGAFGLVAWADKSQCESYEQVTGKETQYVTMMCYIKDDGEWFAWEEYKLRNVTAGAK